MPAAPAEANEGFGVVVSDPISLVEQVQASIKLIDIAIARETSPGDGDAAGVIVPTTSRAISEGRHALDACTASLETALRSLFEAGHPYAGRCGWWPAASLATIGAVAPRTGFPRRKKMFQSRNPRNIPAAAGWLTAS